MGRPRSPHAIERDEHVLLQLYSAFPRGRRSAVLAEILQVDQRFVRYSLDRLRRRGLVERRDGYQWYATPISLTGELRWPNPPLSAHESHETAPRA